MKTPISIMLLLFSISTLAQPAKYFEKKQYVGGKTAVLPYRLLSPQGAGQGELYPLIIFLHGAGERGSDNKAQLLHVVTDFAQPENLEKHPCFVIAPQCPEGKRWVEVSWKNDRHTMPEKPSAPMQMLIELMNEFIASHPVDTNRIYVTGLSMGGFGTWDLISRFPHKFAAAVPICGGGDTKQAPHIKHIPLWAFHGSADKVVSVHRTRAMIEALRKAGGSPKYTEYKGVGHLSWNKAYDEPDLMNWIFSQAKNK